MSIFSSLLLLLLLLPLLLLTSFIIPSSSVSELAFIFGFCSQTKVTPGSAYYSGVNSLLTSIVNDTMISSYNNLTVLASSSSPSSSQDIPIYGLFQCRGDLAAADCSHCVLQAVSQLGNSCRDFTGGALQLEGCLVIYGDSEFMGVEDKTLFMKKCGPPDGFNSDVLIQRDTVLAYLETSSGVYKMFRMTSSGNLQGMAQCVGNLSPSKCQDCLSNVIGRLREECGAAQWGQIYLAKCYARYFEGGDDSPGGNSEGGDDSPGGNFEGGDHSPDGNGKHKNKNKKLQKTITIAVGVTAGGTLLIISIKFLMKKVEAPAPSKSEIETMNVKFEIEPRQFEKLLAVIARGGGQAQEVDLSMVSGAESDHT